MVPRLEKMCSTRALFPVPSHQNVCRDINQFPSLLGNSHQPLKHALLFITHLKLTVEQPNQQTVFGLCNFQVRDPFLCSPFKQNSLKRVVSIPRPHSFSFQLTLMEFPSMPLPWKNPYQDQHQPTSCQRNINSVFILTHFLTVLMFLWPWSWTTSSANDAWIHRSWKVTLLFKNLKTKPSYKSVSIGLFVNS